MTSLPDDLNPSDFAGTAEQAVAACQSLDIHAIAKRLAADGLLGIMAHEDLGGLGLPLPFAVPLASAAGAGLLAFPLIETLLVASLDEPALTGTVRRVIAGEIIVSMGWRGVATVKRMGEQTLLTGTIGRAPCAMKADVILVPLDDGRAALVPCRASGVEIEDSQTLALEVPEQIVTLRAVSLNECILISEEALSTLRLKAQILRAATILGSAEKALAMAVTHVSDRRQFGKALVSNQAVRHMLARYKLSLEGIRQGINRAMRPSGVLDRLMVNSAFLYAAREGVVIAEGAIQLHGGMGFTWDVITHRHLRLVQTLGLQGDTHQVLADMAEGLIDEQSAVA